MQLGALSPFGPIFGKELRAASRRRRNYLLRVVYLAGLLLVLLWAWAITRAVWGATGVAARQQQQEQLGYFFFIFFSMFSVIGMGLIGAVLTSTAINSERTHKTLHVLLMTPLTAWQIVAGKLFSRLLTALMLLGLSLPVLALVRLLGSVEVSQMFGVIAIATVVAMSSAALGLFLSITVKRAYAVILLAYFLMGIAYLFVPMMMLLWASATGRRGAMQWVSIIAAYNPYWCAGILASGQSRLITTGWVPCVLIHIGLTGVLLVLSALLLRRLARREGEAAAPVVPPIPMMEVAFDPSVRSIPPPPQVRPGRSVSDHPVLWRELRRPLMASRWQRYAGAASCMALLGLTYFFLAKGNDLGDRDTQIGYALVFQTLLMVLCCVIPATAIAQEKEGDTWTILLATPLSGSAIVWHKAFGAMRRLMWPAIAAGGHFLIFTVAGIIRPTTFLLIMTVLITFNAIWIATGVALSLFCRRVTVAVIINLALPVVFYVASALLLVVADVLLFDSRLHSADLETWWLPYYYLIEGISRGGIGSSLPRLPGVGSTAQVQRELFLAVAATVGCLHLAAGSAILSATAAAFNRIVGRAPPDQAPPPPPPGRGSQRLIGC